MRHTNLIEMLLDCCSRNSGIRFINASKDDCFITYNELYLGSLKTLNFLQKCGLNKNDKVIIYLEDNKKFLYSFWGCVLGGIVAVPITVGENQVIKDKVQKVFNTLDNPKIMTSSSLFKHINCFDSIERENILLFEEIDFNGEDGIPTDVHEQDIAFIQFSSGSTSEPKGVILSHENLISNLNAITLCSETTDNDKAISWMPLTHDMGLIGFHLTPMYVGIDQILMPSTLFIRNPLLYLEKAAEYKATLLCSPNFGIKHILKYLSIKKDFQQDLSHIRLLFNGAEPISYELCLKFIEVMGGYGVNRNIMYPVYGMAEASLAISFPKPGASIEAVRVDRRSIIDGEEIKYVDDLHEDAVSFVKVGKPVTDCEVMICDDKGIILGENHIGNIYIRGRNVTKGYYNNEEANKAAFKKDGWLETGDLGFICNGELVITGRKKDIIFINGQNFYPHDIERLIEDFGDSKIRSSAACGISNDDKEDEIVLFIASRYTNEEFYSISEKIRSYVSSKIGKEVKIVIPVNNIPKTTSGKIQRYKLAQNYINGEYNLHIENILKKRTVVLPDDTVNEIESKLMPLFAEALEVEHVPIDKNFFEMGGDSLKAVYLLNRVEEEFHSKFQVQDVISDFSVRGIAKLIPVYKKEEVLSLKSIDESEYYDVLPSQKKLFVLNTMENAKLMFNIIRVFEIDGKADTERIKKALEKLTEIHQALRTNFTVINGEVYQKVKDRVEIDFFEGNLCKEELEKFIEKFNSPFDLENDVLFKTAVINVDGKDMIIFCIHHIIIDGKSLGYLIKDFLDIYNGVDVYTPKFALKEYAAWKSEFNKTDSYKSQKDYWIKKFLQNIPVLNLPCDYSRPKTLQYKGHGFQLCLSAELSEKIRKFASKNYTTEYLVLFAIFSVLINKFSNQNEFIIGTPVAGRSIIGTERIIGMLINTLPIRINIDTNTNFMDYFKTFSKAIFEDLSNSTYFCEELIEDLNIKPASNRNPLFDIVFNMQNMFIPELVIDGRKLTEVKVTSKTSKVDLTIDILPKDNRYLIDVEYSTELFKEETIRNFINKYMYLIEVVIDNPNTIIKDIEILDKSEKHKIICDFNKTELNIPLITFKEAFENQVKSTPNNVAVYYGSEFLTYKELNEKANWISQIISKNKQKANDNIALLMKRGRERAIALVGSLKSGCAYIPIEPDLPIERINYILNDSKANILITDKKLEEEIQFKGFVLEVQSTDAIESVPENPTNTINPNDIAYIIYTSGTTGMPKGVLVQNKNLMGYIFAFLKEFKLTQEDRILQQASYAFDAFVEEMYPILITGGSVHVCSNAEVKDINMLVRKLKDEGITIVSASPLLINEINKHEFESNVHTYISGGDVLKWEYINNLIKKANIYNTYGPTETTVCATYYKCNETDKNKKLPIGKPIANYKVYIMDINEKLCPIGVPGELCIGGIGVSKGYLNNEVLTSEKFIRNPFDSEEYIYKTGDLARWLQDGNIEYLGRIDNQVSIRGYRIELGEIESHLLNFYDVREAVVIDREDENGDKFLCAYIAGNRDFTAIELKKYLARYLPNYMIPSYFVQVDSIPVTVNGKIDKKSLLKLNNYVKTGIEFVETRNDTERKLAKIWEELLNVENVGANDDFFDLGGHSLKASIMVGRIKKEFNTDIPLNEIFNLATLRNISEYIEKARKSQYYPIKKQDKKDYYDISSAQKRLFALNQMDRESTCYNITRAVMIEGDIKTEKVKEVFSKLVDRHEALRTYFKIIDDKPVQIICEDVNFDVEYIETDSSNITNILEKFVRPFDLQRAPLFRIGLIKLAEERHIMVLDINHIISDGISISIIIKDFISIYSGDELQEIPIQYKDYSIWEKEVLRTEDFKKQAEFWLNTYKGNVPILNLPTDYPRPRLYSSEGDTYNFKIDKGTLTRLKELSIEHGTTLFIVLLAMYNILLYKYTQMEDIVVGTVTAGRPHADLENVVGMFVNTLAIRNHLDVNKSFIEFLKEVKKTTLKAFENQDYPFEELVSQLNLNRDISRNALFDTMFVLQNMEIPQLDVGDLKINQFDVPRKTSMFDLTLEAMEKDGCIEFTIEYCTKLFKKETIERLSRHFINTIKSVLYNPYIKICDIDILSQKERRQILYEFNDTKQEHNNDKCFHILFEEQVAKTPDNVALVFEDISLTYYELNRKANCLANILRIKGVEPNKIVGLIAERSIERIVGLLAILKSGGAYLPIDPEYPIERVKYIIEDSGIDILLTYGNQITEIPFKGERIDIGSKEIYDSEGVNLPNINRFSDLAYIIYTSGTTGKPKGVMVEHKNLYNYIYAFLKEFKVNENDVVLQQASYSFDAFVEELYPALIKGASVALTQKEDLLDMQRLVALIKKWNVTMISCSPLLLNEINKLPKMDSIHTYISGGDVLKPEYIGNLLKYANVYNTYGPTETTVCASYYRCNPDTHYSNIPLGKPISNYKIYILDNNRMLLPIGVPGELCISGLGVTRGYINRPETTAEKFVESPYYEGERIYRTGDLARWLPDGNIEYLGRIDNQVNIKGYRIELEEIESQLMSFDGVQEAVVIDREDETGNKYLCAYITGVNEFDFDNIRNHLARFLPSYMIPSYIIKVESIPVTPNGKVDRRALPKPSMVLNDKEYVAPRNEIEKCLVSIWEQILGVKNIGINHNFFTLGGDSIKAIQVVSQLQQHKLKLEIKDLFLHPTVGEVSQYIVTYRRKAEQEIVEGEVCFTPIQKWFFEQQFKERDFWNQSVLLMGKDRFDEDAINATIYKVIEQHDALRMVYKQSEGNLIQYNRGIEGDIYILKSFDVYYTDEEKVKEFIETKRMELNKLVNLETGPLVVVSIFRTNKFDYISLAIHHLVVDGVSWRIILEDFFKAYYQVVNKQVIDLQEKTDSFKEWASRLQNYANSEEFLEEISYWENVENIKIKKLPKGKTSEVGLVKDSNTITATLSKIETEKLLREVSKAYNTEINDILLTALGLALKKWCGDGNYAVLLEGHGRENIIDDIDISRTVGWFTATYPFILDMSKQVDISYYIKSVKESLRRVPNKGMGYGILKYISSKENITNRLCFSIDPEISFNYLGQFDYNQEMQHIGISLVSSSLYMSQEESRERTFEINCGINNGEFILTLNYNKFKYEEHEIKEFTDSYMNYLKLLIEHCISKEETEMTPSDFTFSEISFDELEALTEEIDILID